MKLIKFIAAAALVVSTSLVSGTSATPAGLTQDVAGVCPNWPFCREIEIAEQGQDLQLQLKTKVLLNHA
jgi:hypothetical protein